MTEQASLLGEAALPLADEIERGTGRPKSGYYTANGERVPSSTTITGRYMNPRGLYFGHWRNGKEGRDFDDWGTKALEVGGLIHATIEAEINGTKLPMIPPELEPQVRSGIESWHEWFLSHNFTIVATEVPLVSDAYRFGGTLDAVFRDRRGRDCIGDYKSSKALYANYLWQVASYKILWEECRGPIEGGIHLVRFSKEHGDMEHRYYPELGQAEELFVLLREAYELDKVVEKRIK